MPSTSPGPAAPSTVSQPFDKILPGNPVQSLQSLDTFVYRERRYVAYITGSQLNILIQPNFLVQALTFNHALVAVAADDETGKLLVAGARDIWVLRPQTEGWTKIWWEKALKLQREDAGDETRRICWGCDGEALVGGSRVLSLFSTRPASRASSSLGYAVDQNKVEIRQALWSKDIPSPLLYSEFSPGGSLIASCSRYDRLLKIWRRLSYEEGLFDQSYLRHGGSITHVQWRSKNQSSQERRNSGVSNKFDDEAETLFTVADDALVRIWRTGGLHDVDIMVQYATIDLVSSIPHSPNVLHKHQAPSTPTRFFFILPSDQFCAAIQAVVGYLKSDIIDHVTEHLNFMASQDPDVIVSFDGHGKMSAWGLQSIGHKRRPATPTAAQPFHITHAEELAFRIPVDTTAVFKTWLQEDKLNFLVHSLNDHGQISWWEGNVKSLFSLSAPGIERLSCKCTWQGHSAPVSGFAVFDELLTSQASQESKVWKVVGDNEVSLVSKSLLGSDKDSVIGLDQGRQLSLSGSKITLWDVNGKELTSTSQSLGLKPQPYITTSDFAGASGYLLTPEDGAIAQLSAKFSKLTTATPSAELSIQSIETKSKDLKFRFATIVKARAHDPTGHHVIACTSAGLIYRGSSFGKAATTPSWEEVTNVGVVDPANFAATVEFAAVVGPDAKSISTVDLDDGFVDKSLTFGQEIKHVEGLTVQPRLNFLAVAFSDSVQLLIGDYYSKHSALKPTWVAVKNVSLQDVGLQISGIAWLPNATMAVAAGNGVFLSDRSVYAKHLESGVQEILGVDAGLDSKIEMRQLAFQLQKPAPVWQPVFLSYLVHCGIPARAAYFLSRLARELKFWSPGDHLDACLGESPVGLLAKPEERFVLSDDTVADLKEQLEEKILPQLPHAKHHQVKHVLDAMIFLKDHVNGLDHNALRFLYVWKLRILEHQASTTARDGDDGAARDRPKPIFVPTMGWRDVAFARQSTTQQPLLDFFIRHYENKITWPIARDLGIVAWLTDREALQQIFEQLAQTAYRSQQPPDPVDASLYFLALHKKPTLLGLWRIATWHKEQRSTMNFLKRDFSQAEARTAAKKNAYALMGKRRFAYSAAFFLLADDPASACSVLAGQCEDLPLAIAVARLYSGDGSSVLRKLLEDRVMPQAKRDNNRWLLSWCHTVLLEREQAAEVLVVPLRGVRFWYQDEPSILYLYQQLKRRPSEHEYTAVLRSARILRKMGFWLSALDLVSHWRFETQAAPMRSSTQAAIPVVINGDHDVQGRTAEGGSPSTQAPSAPSLLDGFVDSARSSPAPMDDKAAREAKAAELLKKLKAKKEGQQAATNEPKPTARAPTQFKEPDANSLLDSFGF